jgi:Trk K+ transport system NAD-binding subunit
MKLKYLAAIVASAFVVPAMAQTDMPRVDKREANQEKRIEQGVQSGQLTPKETARLEKGQQKVEKMEAKATADGKVTKREKAKLAHAQNKQSRHIAKQKHDRQKAPPAPAAGSGG